MRRLVNVMLIFHWTGVFGLLAGLAVSDGDRGVPAVLSMLGAAPADMTGLAPGSLATAGLAAALALAALLCVWAFIAEWTGGRAAEGADPFRIALAGGGFALTMAAGYAMLYDVGMVPGIVALYFMALLATHLVVTREEMLEMLRSGDDATARAMAAGAARYYDPGFPRAGQPAAGWPG